MTSVLRRRCRWWILAAWSFPISALPVFQVQSIGPSGQTGSATAINGTGVVVGNYTLPDGSNQGFLWQNGAVTSLHLPPGTNQTWATSISGTGTVGGYSTSAGSVQGSIWSNLGTPLSSAGAFVTALTPEGEGAGMATAADGTGLAFVGQTGVRTAQTQPAGGSWSAVNAVSQNGMAAGTAMNGNGSFNAFTWAPGGTVTVLSGLSGQNSYGMAINNSGVVAGHSQADSGALLAAIWSGTTVQSLGTLGGLNSYSYGINSAGQVIGYSDIAGESGTAAFLYNGDQLYNLNDLIGGDPSWQLLAAYGINDRGQIVGKGIHLGEQQAFLLNPVSPSVRINSFTAFSSEPAEVPEPDLIWPTAASLFLILIGSLARTSRKL